MIQDWKLLEQAALPGTGQSTGTIPLVQSLKGAVPADETREHEALLAAGSLSLMRRAGFTPRAATSAWPLAAAETIPALGETGRSVIARIVDARDETLLLQYLELLDAAQPPRRIPHSCLVPLLGAARNEEQRARIFHHAGERGRWLAERNPAWKKFLEAASDEDVWAVGTLSQRVAFFQQLRAENPAAARDLLTAGLKEETAKTLEQIVPVLKTGLSLDDEPLLLLLSKHKGLSVKHMARGLLLSLPQSDLSQKAFALAAQYLKVKRGLLGGKQLEVELPPAFEDSLQEYNIVKQMYQFPGERAGLLGQIVANVHPDRWLAHFAVDRKELLALFRKNDHGPLLVAALANAASRFTDTETTLTILAVNRDGKDEDVEELLGRQDFASYLPSEAFQPELEAFLKSPSDTLGIRVFSLLASSVRNSGTWSLAFTQLVIRFMEKRNANYRLHFAQSTLAREVFFKVLPPGAEALVQEFAQRQVAASRMPPEVFSEYEQLTERWADVARMRASLVEAPMPD